MVLPLLVAGGLGIAGTLLGGKFGSKKEMLTQSYQTTETYAPTYAPTISKSYQVQYTAPVIQIQSPKASVTSKKEMSSEQTQEPRIMPYIIPTQSVEPSQQASAMSEFLPLVIIIGGFGLAYALLK